MRRRRNPEIISGRVNSGGAVEEGTGFTAQRTGVGTYNVIFDSGFKLLGATITMYAGYGVVSAFSERIFTVNAGTVASPSVAQDSGFSFTAVGIQQ
jgi:hypothetical protein